LLSADHSVKQKGPIGRALRNAGWLLGGNGLGGLFSLAYLGIATRSLGLDGFGRFALILAYGGAAANIVGFQSWQTVIRYGASHMAEGQPGRLRRVLAFAAGLDVAAALLGAILAAAAALAFGSILGWSVDDQRLAAVFSLSLIVGVRGMPVGLLRLLNRFDLAACGELAVPAMRLIGASTVAALGGGILGYLIAWSAADLAATVAVWFFACRELRLRGIHRDGSRVAGVLSENPGLWRFTWTTNLASSLWLFWFQAPVLVVGWLAGPVGAGAFRIATQIGNAPSKPIIALARSIYPEFARIQAVQSGAALLPVIKRTAGIAALFGLISIVCMTWIGKWLLLVIAGPAYVSAYPMLVLLTIASAVGFAGFGLEPALVAIGRPALALGTSALITFLFCAALVMFLLLWGPIGAAVATIVGQFCSITLYAAALKMGLRSAHLGHPVRAAFVDEPGDGI